MSEAGGATFIGSAGVSLLLLAFFMNLFGWLRRDGYAYLLLNLTGGALACYSSHLIGFLPFVVLEGTWAVVAAVAVVRKVSARERGPGRTGRAGAGEI